MHVFCVYGSGVYFSFFLDITVPFWEKSDGMKFISQMVSVGRCLFVGHIPESLVYFLEAVVHGLMLFARDTLQPPCIFLGHFQESLVYFLEAAILDVMLLHDAVYFWDILQRAL